MCPSDSECWCTAFFTSSCVNKWVEHTLNFATANMEFHINRERNAVTFIFSPLALLTFTHIHRVRLALIYRFRWPASITQSSMLVNVSTYPAVPLFLDDQGWLVPYSLKIWMKKGIRSTFRSDTLSTQKSDAGLALRSWSNPSYYLSNDSFHYQLFRTFTE